MDKDTEPPLALAARLAAKLAAAEGRQPSCATFDAAAEPLVFPPGCRVQVLEVCVPTDLLSLGGGGDDDAGDWTAGWVLGMSRQRLGTYRLVLDDGDVEECVEASCLRKLIR
jgi:hypothetical protein